jgi:hypothetical protein
MSALSLINQFQVLPYDVGAGGGIAGVQDTVLNATIPAGFFIGSVTIALGSAGVTSGDFVVSYNAVAISTTILGDTAVQPTATSTFFVVSNGADNLTIDVVGQGSAWTSGQTTLYLRQIA